MWLVALTEVKTRARQNLSEFYRHFFLDEMIGLVRYHEVQDLINVDTTVPIAVRSLEELVILGTWQLLAVTNELHKVFKLLHVERTIAVVCNVCHLEQLAPELAFHVNTAFEGGAPGQEQKLQFSSDTFNT